MVYNGSFERVEFPMTPRGSSTVAVDGTVAKMSLHIYSLLILWQATPNYDDVARICDNESL
jgi:hypothetical protein